MSRRSEAADAVAVTADAVVRAASAVYRGCNFRETASAAAIIRIYDNATTNTGTLLETINLASLGTFSTFYDPGVLAANGIYVDIVSGAVEGSIRVD
jgi:hypothetical protein